MSAADEFFRALGLDSVDQRLERIAATSAAMHSSLKAGLYKSRIAAVNRWVVRQLDLCARIFCRPPPPELVKLIEHLLGVDCPERNGRIKNREKFVAAVHYVAEYPDATPAKIARAITYDQKSVIARWLQDSEFKELVGTRRFRLAHQQKKGT
jgi:hypothetical protein